MKNVRDVQSKKYYLTEKSWKRRWNCWQSDGVPNRDMYIHSFYDKLLDFHLTSTGAHRPSHPPASSSGP